MAPISRPAWWAAMRENHAVLGVFHTGSSFSLLERSLFLGLAVAAAWIGVFLKYFYIRQWVPMLFDEVLDELQLFPSDWLSDHLDSALCAVAGGMVDVFLGKELVRKIMRKDWENQGGLRAVASAMVTVYAFLLATGGLCHFAYFFSSKPDLRVPLTTKWVSTLALKLAVVETGLVTVKAVSALRNTDEKKA
eukprot:TRINITY_DN26384_c0_g2_i1.p1 TRINITY_DN26384_c0_g2~~TRINITY_DN26384_c0_g2_i1.p1  ORF type:complete len:208 (+),score=45.99 TRINITY_DN26384_c0_g2_i1:51-626(+)